MAANKVVSVYLQGADATSYRLVTQSVPIANLLACSGLARGQLGGKDNRTTRFILPSNIKDLDIAKRLFAWIKTNDPKKWETLTVDNLKIDHFDDLVNVYATAYALHLDRVKRGNGLRDEISKYIHAFPITRDEFATILEVLDFDKALGFSVKNQVMHLYVKGPGHVPPEMDLIDAYCKQKKGLWEQMKGIEAEIRLKMAFKEARTGDSLDFRAWRQQAGCGGK